MQWIAVALSWLSGLGAFWPGGYEMSQDSHTQSATVFALVYGYPLVSYVNLALSIAKQNGSFITNAFYHQTELATSNFTDINRPNVDTLYSEALVDLSTMDLVVSLPPMPEGRFYVFPFYDVYGNNFANIGTANDNSPGDYLVSYRPSDPGDSTGDADYAGYIFMPTPYGAIDLRIQVDNSTDSQFVATHIQPKFILKTVETSRQQAAPRLTESLLTDDFSDDPTTALLELTARLAYYNPPEVKGDVFRVSSVLKLAGMDGPFYEQPNNVNLTAAALAAEDAVMKARNDFKKNYRDLGNGWAQLRAHLSGDFKSHFDVRALVAAQGYLQLTADQAVYPIYAVTSSLQANQTYNITFYGKPQVNGFWSLTAYTEEVFLVPNQLNRYSLGDRSAITYPDGSLVYGPNGSPDDSHAPFSLLLQTTDITPPSKYCSNWLPTPSGDVTFDFNLRWYAPTGELLDNTYEYPLVEIIEPLVGLDNTCSSY